MDNPLTAMLLLTTTTGGVWSKLSDTKKGMVAIIGAVILGFSVGTATVAQIGLPQRVEALEAVVTGEDGLRPRVALLEREHNEAEDERRFLLRAIQWNNCALEAQNDGDDMRTVCGSRPLQDF